MSTSERQARKAEIEDLLDAIEDKLDMNRRGIARLESEHARLSREYGEIEQAKEDDPQEPEPFSLIDYPHFADCACGTCPAWEVVMGSPVAALEQRSA